MKSVNIWLNYCEKQKGELYETATSESPSSSFSSPAALPLHRLSLLFGLLHLSDCISLPAFHYVRLWCGNIIDCRRILLNDVARHCHQCLRCFKPNDECKQTTDSPMQNCLTYTGRKSTLSPLRLIVISLQRRHVGLYFFAFPLADVSKPSRRIPVGHYIAFRPLQRSASGSKIISWSQWSH